MHAYIILREQKLKRKDRREGESRREREKEEKAQSVYPGQSSLKTYSNPINQKSLDFLKLHWSHFWSQNLK